MLKYKRRHVRSKIEHPSQIVKRLANMELMIPDPIMKHHKGTLIYTETEY